jgi:hypothetical protein
VEVASKEVKIKLTAKLFSPALKGEAMKVKTNVKAGSGRKF